jgi:hypothetical protein
LQIPLGALERCRFDAVGLAHDVPHVESGADAVDELGCRLV